MPRKSHTTEQVNDKARDGLLDGEILFRLEEATTLIGRWREEDFQVRPHSALGYRPPAPQARRRFAQPVSAPGQSWRVVHTVGTGHA